MAAANQNDLAKVFLSMAFSDESADFYKVFQDLKHIFGPAVCPLVVFAVYSRWQSGLFYINLFGI